MTVSGDSASRQGSGVAVAVPASETGGLESAAGTPAAESRFPCLDGFRALAALAVVLTHVGFQTGRSLHGGGHSILARCDIGVPVFFVLSGFLLYRPMAYARLSGRALPTWRDYLVRRALRILPAYWVSIVVAMLVLDLNAPARHQAWQWVQRLLLVQVYSVHDRTVGFEQDWSLCVEATFYLFLPMWPRLLHRASRGRPSLRVEVIGAMVLVAVTYAWVVLAFTGRGLPERAAPWLPGHLDWFVCGMMLGVVSVLPSVRPAAAARWHWLTEIADSPTVCWLGAAAVFALAVTPLAGRDDLAPMALWQAVSREVLFAAFAVLLLLPGFLGDQSRGWPRRLMQSPPLRQLGMMSYGIFLLHMGDLYLVYQIMGYQVFGGHFWAVLVMVLGLAVSTAYLSLRFVEMPALRLKQRFAPRPTSRSAASAPG